MRIMLIILYIILYISHIIFGPYYYRFILKGEKPKYKSKNIDEILKKNIYITYISMIYTIYFLIKLDSESYLCALLMTILSLVLYIIKYKNSNSEHYKESIIDHIILILPFLYYKNKYNIKISEYKPNIQSIITIIILMIYSITHKKIYT